MAHPLIDGVKLLFFQVAPPGFRDGQRRRTGQQIYSSRSEVQSMAWSDEPHQVGAKEHHCIRRPFPFFEKLLNAR